MNFKKEGTGRDHFKFSTHEDDGDDDETLCVCLLLGSLSSQ